MISLARKPVVKTKKTLLLSGSTAILVWTKVITKDTMKRLQEINNYVIFCTDLDLCVRSIELIYNEKALWGHLTKTSAYNEWLKSFQNTGNKLLMFKREQHLNLVAPGVPHIGRLGFSLYARVNMTSDTV